MNLFDKILKVENIKEAYFEVVEKFEEQLKTRSYRGYDAMNLSDYDLSSHQLVKDIHDDLKNNIPIAPAIKREIPKKNKSGTREVYIHLIKERVRAQAITRIVEPVFNQYFSPYLFSYRKTHTHECALKTVVRRYLRDESSAVLVGDISRYSDIINPRILKKQLQDIGFDKQTYTLLCSYIDMGYWDGIYEKKSHEGIITGLPITVFFNNLYLDAMDKKIGPQVSLYRRVGDDFIAIDTVDSLESAYQDIQHELKKCCIDSKDQKIKIQKMSEPFEFLGLNFNQGIISIRRGAVRNIKIHVKHSLRYHHSWSIGMKKKNLITICYRGDSLHHYFKQLVRQYSHVNDIKQIQSLSDYFYVRLTLYFFGKYSSRNRRKTQEIISSMNLPSLFYYYKWFQSGNLKKIDQHASSLL